MPGKTVAIIYGFTEGLWHGKRMRRVLRESGYSVVHDPKQASVIIAHSGGCYYVPKVLRPEQQIMLINPPYWPEKPLGVRGRNMVWQLAKAVRPGNLPFYHMHKTSRNIGYLVRHQRVNRDMVRLAQVYNLAEEVVHPNIILVRNSNDPWLTPDLAHLQRINPKLNIVQLPGDHDDCWLHPEPYIKLLQS